MSHDNSASFATPFRLVRLCYDGVDPLSGAEAVREIERYIMNPGQATAYKIGMMKIMNLRAEAKRELGAKFDIRKFHDVILRSGAVPLNILDEQVQEWIATEKAQAKAK